MIEASDLDVYYGDFRAVRDVDLVFGRNEITALIGPSGCGKSTLLRCFNRMNDLVPGARVDRARSSTTARTSTAATSTRSRCGAASAWSSRSPTRSPSRSTTTSPMARGSTGMKVKNMDEMVERGAARRGPLGRGQGQAQPDRPRPLRRPAAAALHRAHHRGRARGDPDGRALLGARPDRDRPDRGPDASSCARTTRSSS